MCCLIVFLLEGKYLILTQGGKRRKILALLLLVNTVSVIVKLLQKFLFGACVNADLQLGFRMFCLCFVAYERTFPLFYQS
jgi:hypothetical protein